MTKQEDTAQKYELTLVEESSFLISCQSLQACELAGFRLSLKSPCTVCFDLVKRDKPVIVVLGVGRS